MSSFKTEIPIHIDRIKALLPEGSTVERWEWKDGKLFLFWHNGKLQTKYLWPWPWTIAELESASVPQGVTTPEEREQAAKAFEAAQERESFRLAQEAAEKLDRETREAHKRAAAIAAEAAKVRSQDEKVLTQSDSSSKTPIVEKMAGKLHRKTKGKSRTNRGASVDAAASAAAVVGTGPKPTGGVSAEHDGP